MDTDTMIAAVDAGGTSFKCALVRADGTIVRAWRIPTRMPEETLAACAASFKAECAGLGITPRAIGIASFGPVDIDPYSVTYGTITGTAKQGWSGSRLARHLASHWACHFIWTRM